MNSQPIENKEEILRRTASYSPPSQFLDYRHFFRELKSQMEVQLGRYTYAQFSADLGFARSHVSYVLVNELRKLSSAYRKVVESTLQLPAVENKYLRELVTFTHAKSHGEKQASFDRLVAIKAEALPMAEDRASLRFFTDWRHAAIFELFELDDFNDDWQWIAAQFGVPLSEEDILNSLQLLQELKLIQTTDDGQRRKTNAAIAMSDQISGLAVAGYHSQMMDKAKEAMSNTAADKREYSALTLSLSPKYYQRLLEDLRMIKHYAVHLSELSEEKKHVIQLNFQLFPLTKV